MLKQISWTEYFVAIGLLLLIYYVLIVVVYFRSDIWQLVSGKKQLALATAGNTVEQDVNTDEEKLYNNANNLIAELKLLFAKKYVKEELIVALQQKLKSYNFLKETAYQASINNFIELEAENKSSLYLSEEELRIVWMG